MGIYYITLSIWTLVFLLIHNVERKSFELSNFNKQYSSNKNISAYAIFMAFCIFIISGLKDDSVGVDTLNYFGLFLESKNFSLSRLSWIEIISGEIGHKITMWFFSNYFNWRIYNICYSLLVSYSFGNFFYRYSSNIFLSFFIHVTFGLFTVSLSAYRQCIAVSIILLFYKYLLEKKELKFYIGVLIASSFHMTAIICLLFPIIEKFTIKQKNIILPVFLLLPFLTRLFGYLFFDLVSTYLPVKYILHMNGYGDAPIINPLVEAEAFVILFAGLMAIKTARIKLNNGILRLFVYTSLYVSCIELSRFVHLSSRLSYYFIPFLTVFIPTILSCQTNRIRKIFSFLICLIMLMHFVVSSYGGHILAYENYKFFW